MQTTKQFSFSVLLIGISVLIFPYYWSHLRNLNTKQVSQTTSWGMLNLYACCTHFYPIRDSYSAMLPISKFLFPVKKQIIMLSMSAANSKQIADYTEWGKQKDRPCRWERSCSLHNTEQIAAGIFAEHIKESGPLQKSIDKDLLTEGKLWTITLASN